MITARLKNYRQSPRKVRLVTDLIKGKQVDDALGILEFTTKRSSTSIKKLINSVIANAKHNFNITDTKDLYIKDIRVDAGITMHRFMPRARGSAYPIKKRTSHVKIVLENRAKDGSVTGTISEEKEVITAEVIDNAGDSNEKANKTSKNKK